MKFFVRGQKEKAGEADFEVAVMKAKKLSQYDKLLKAFKYQEALDTALATKHPVVVISLIEELLRRNGLKIALSGRDEVTLEPFVSFLIKFITQPKYSSMLIDVAHILFDLYAAVIGQSVVFDELFIKLRNKLNDELRVQKKLMSMLGALDIVVAAK